MANKTPKAVKAWGEWSEGCGWLCHGGGLPFLSRTKPNGRYYRVIRVLITPIKPLKKKSRGKKS